LDSRRKPDLYWWFREKTLIPRSLVVYVPITIKKWQSAYEADLGKPSFLREDSVAKVQGLGSIPTQRLERKLGVISFDLLNKVKAALRFALEL
jgi:mRNA interferase MazF